MENKRYDYDPYVLFDDWSNAVFYKLGYDIYGSTEEELVNISGESLMVVDGIVQECSIFSFFTELLVSLGLYDKDGYKTMDVEDAINLICSPKAMDKVLLMFKEYHIKLGEPKFRDITMKRDLEYAKHFQRVYGGERTINELIEHIITQLSK